MKPSTNTASANVEAAAPDDIDPVSGMVESAFLAKFREKFFGSPDPQSRWPRASLNTATERANDCAAVLRTLFMLKEGSVTPEGGPEGSARQLIAELVTETGWPGVDPGPAGNGEDGSSVPVPDPWKATRWSAFRRYEIASALNILMMRLGSSGPGGDPSGYPPQRPN